MKSLISMVILAICLSGCVGDLVSLAISQAGSYVLGEAVTALDESNKKVDKERAEKANQYQPSP